MLSEAWRFAGIAFEAGLVVLVLRELERSERQQLANQDLALARQRSGKTWKGLFERFNSAMRERWFCVSRWAFSQRAKAKQSKGKNLTEYKKLTWEARR